MCSHFLSSSDSSVARALVSEDKTYRYNTVFTPGKLPPCPFAADQLTPQEAGVFLDYLFDGLLRRSRAQGSCGSCWAYSVTGCVGYAARRAYRDLGCFFNAQYMSHQYLLTCMQVEGVACGCWGGNLPEAFRALEERGAVTFLQFPYENDESVSTSEGQVHYVCKANADAGGYLGTCGPCAAGEASFEVVVRASELGAKAPEGFLELVTCMPCESVGGPFYHPAGSCSVFDPRRSLQENVDATKSALRRFGPLSTALRINQQDFAAANRPEVLRRLRDAPVYRPVRTPAAGGLHAVLIVGYWDPWAQSGLAEDRARAVFVCRNSWGPEWGFKVRSVEVVEKDHRELRLSPVTLGGFFCVAMYDAVEATGVLEHAVAVPRLRIRPTTTEPPRELSSDDPFLFKFPPGMQRDLKHFSRGAEDSLEARWSTATLARDGASPSAGAESALPWLAALAAALFLLMLLVAGW